MKSEEIKKLLNCENPLEIINTICDRLNWLGGTYIFFEEKSFQIGFCAEYMRTIGGAYVNEIAHGDVFVKVYKTDKSNDYIEIKMPLSSFSDKILKQLLIEYVRLCELHLKPQAYNRIIQGIL